MAVFPCEPGPVGSPRALWLHTLWKEPLEISGMRFLLVRHPSCHKIISRAQFSASRGIWPLPQNFRVFAEFHGISRKIPWQRPNSVSLYCCCNCDTESLRTATQACWFKWRVFTSSLLTCLSFYLLDLCRWRWLVTETDWLARSTDEWRRN